MSDVKTEANRRRTFAIISHPDAGKTTLTEKFLLYGGALTAGAGAVKARAGRRSATSDWMEMEQQRGISITSAALQFEYRDCIINLLDTPGHRDFSEDTYRVLVAADAAVMVLDAAKGIEPQTLKLFEVCREREIPFMTFINKWDRPGLGALQLLDEIEKTLIVEPTPVTWPVGLAGEFKGIIHRGSGDYIRFTRTAHGSTIAPEEIVTAEQAQIDEGEAWTSAAEETELLDALERSPDVKTFLACESTPVFFGSAMTNFGVRALLDGVVDLVPSPTPRALADGGRLPVDAPFSGLVFKVQAGMDKSHRDRIAFVRVCSGQFERGMMATAGGTGRQFSTKYAQTLFGQDRETVDLAYPGDILGLVNATDVRVGDAIYSGGVVDFPELPAFAPEFFMVARVLDTSKFKQFRKGIAQLDEEGAVQVLRDPDLGDQAPILAAVGQLQFEVASSRLENEFGAPVELNPTRYTIARKTDAASGPKLRAMQGVDVLQRANGTHLALFESRYWMDRVLADHPELTLERMVAEGGLS
ncbi:MAG: peptide chain release factor 3 [Acidimicrobiales bacterium]|nr:peptide chain release factor 3 [Acidimicrobiales bacterium]